MSIISIGDLVLDYYYKDDKLLGVNGGMSSHNIIANLSEKGFSTKVIGVCGDDIQGLTAKESLKDLGVDVSNIDINENINTRCFHVSYYNDENNKLFFTSKKRCPICNEKKWYDESEIDTKNALNVIVKDDILVFDNLNDKNQKIIDKTSNKKMLDLGQYFELDNLTNDEIIKKIKNRFTIINLNERVEKYLLKRFNLKETKSLFLLLLPELIIITRGKKGADFIFDNKLVTEKIEKAEKELDPTGAGDAFFSVFIGEYLKNNFVIDKPFIDRTFIKATKLTTKVVKSMGARGHLKKLYKIKSIDDSCTCKNYLRVTRKQIKRSSININNINTRVINALNSGAAEKLKSVIFKQKDNCLFIGTGGSYAAANFASKVINQKLGCNTYSMLPRDVLYRNNTNINKVIMFSYSGTTNDLLESTKEFAAAEKYIVTKGDLDKVAEKTNISKDNIISYRTVTNKAAEKGFLAFEGAVAPASIFLKLYMQNDANFDCDKFVSDSMKYWDEYFEDIFKNKQIRRILKIGTNVNIFTGDYTTTAAIDLESKIIESGIFNCLVHEKKNFSHGRFINYENLNNNNNIYLKQHDSNKYENVLINYLKDDNNIIVESRYNGILCEFDLLIASQFLIYHIGKVLDIDVSKPDYSESSMKLYFYKDRLN